MLITSRLTCYSQLEDNNDNVQQLGDNNDNVQQLGDNNDNVQPVKVAAHDHQEVIQNSFFKLFI